MAEDGAAMCHFYAWFEAALARAAVLDAGAWSGPLHGLPLGVKDLQDTAGLLTTYGNVRLRGNVPLVDNSLVARLRTAGAWLAIDPQAIAACFKL